MLRVKEFLNRLLVSRNITLSELSAQLGYRSKTALNHILSGKSTYRNVEQFGERLLAHYTLSPDEKKEMQLVLDLLKWKDDFRPIQEMTQLLCGDAPAPGNLTIEIISNDETVSFEERYSNASEIHITLLNSQYVPIFSRIHRLIREKAAQVEHFMLSDDDTSRTIHAIHTVLPIAYEHNYNGYVFPIQSPNDLHRPIGLIASDSMFVQYVNGDGASQMDFYIFDREDHALLMPIAAPSALISILGSFKESCTMLKHKLPKGTAFEDYIHFISDCARLEYNREIYRIKSDVSMDFIPEDIIIRAGIEGSAPTEGMMDEVIGIFRRMFANRFSNTYEKQKTTHTIFRREAMLKFVETGRATDHFWGLRPYTPAERLRILQLLLDQARNNPFFHIHFLKDSSDLRDAEITFYEGIGVMITASNTDYALDSGHSEVLISHPEFNRLFRDFYIRELLANRVLTTEESIQFLHELVSFCEGLQSD